MLWNGTPKVNYHFLSFNYQTNISVIHSKNNEAEFLNFPLLRKSHQSREPHPHTKLWNVLEDEWVSVTLGRINLFLKMNHLLRLTDMKASRAITLHGGKLLLSVFLVIKKMLHYIIWFPGNQPGICLPAWALQKSIKALRFWLSLWYIHSDLMLEHMSFTCKHMGKNV